ncbi:MAG: hypothetical protein LC768_06500 [Acidobacteria bacterium]|nr:hypothetical protein [Acidobacteriota bacterium]MCA1637973.1 hypothetical protein [Acidobacteriota bacterium]
MQKQERIEKLAKDTFRRAVRESVACIFVLIASAYFLQHAPISSAKYYGYLLTLVSTGFILGVVWAFTISRRLAQRHSATDTVFWREAYETQAKLLRFVPLWYVAPLTTGTILVIAPTSATEFTIFLWKLAVVGVVFAGVTYLNKMAAEGLEAEAKEMFS